MAQTVDGADEPAEPVGPATAERPHPSQLLELGLLQSAWRLLREHWWQLAIVALCAYTLHAGAQQLAESLWRVGTLPAYLAFCLVPLAPLGAAVAGLLVLRRHTDRRGSAAVFASLGSVLVAFLVIYESEGTFREDLGDFLYGGFTLLTEDQFAAAAESGEPVQAGGIDLALESGAPLVLATFLVAFLLRLVGSRVVERESLWRDGRWRVARGALRALVGYAEVVWIVVGASVISTGIQGLASWWAGVRVGDGLADWWERVGVDLPVLGPLAESVVAAIGTVLDGLVTGLVAPLAWLAIGVLIYGRTAAQSISQDEVAASIERRNRLASVTRRVDPAVVTLAWRGITNPEGRFGALLGAIVMVFRSRYVPVLVFCLAYTAVTTWAPYLVWEVAYRTLGTRLDYADWLALYGPLNAVVYVLGLCLTMPLIAAYADGLLTRFGAPSQLRLAHRPVRPPAAAPTAAVMASPPAPPA